MGRRAMGFVVGALCCTAGAKADLTGSSVEGSLTFTTPPGSTFGGATNYFDPANAHYPAGAVPTMDGNAGGTTVVIGPEVEFGYVTRLNGYSADFTNGMLQVTNNCNIASCTFGGDVTYTFNDAAFSGLSVDFLSNGLGLTASLSGNVLTLSQNTAALPTGTTSSVLSFGSAASPTPEPSGLVLAGTGVLGVLAAVRRRFER